MIKNLGWELINNGSFTCDVLTVSREIPLQLPQRTREELYKQYRDDVEVRPRAYNPIDNCYWITFDNRKKVDKKPNIDDFL